MSNVLAATRVQISNWNNELVEVPLFQLIQWKHAISLEMKGLRHSRGSVAAHVRKILSAPRSFKKEDLHSFLTEVIDDVNMQLEQTA